MKALKISLISIFAILFISTITIVSVYAAENHKQINSWVNNEVQEIQPKDPELAAAEKLVEQLRQQLKERNATISNLENNLQKIKTEVATANETIGQLQQANSAKESEIQILQSKIEQNNQKIEEYEQNAEQNAEEIARLTRENGEKQANITDLQNTIESNKQSIESLQASVAQKTAKITELEGTIEEKNAQLQQLQSTIEELQQGTATKSSIDKFCERTKQMIIFKVVFFDPELDDGQNMIFSYANFLYDSGCAQEDIDNYVKSTAIDYPERCKLKGFSLEENGEIVETVPYQNTALCLYAVLEDLQPIQINVHIGSTTVEKTVYAKQNYNDVCKPKWINDAHLYNKQFVGFATSPDCTDYESLVHTIDNAGGDYYIVFDDYGDENGVKNSSSMYYLEQIIDEQTFYYIFLDTTGDIGLMMYYFEMHKNESSRNIIAWSTTIGGDDNFEVNQGNIKDYSKLYAVFAD